MLLTINVPQLAQELRLLNQVALQKATISIYTTLLLQTTDDGLCLTACDGDRMLRVVCPARVAQHGSTVVGAKKLADIFERLPPDTPAQLSFEHDTLVIESGGFRSRLQTRQPEDFIHLPADVPGESFELTTGPFLQIVDRIRYAINDKGVTKYTLSGALLEARDGRCVMVTTDGKRLALASMPYRGSDMSLLIPSKTLDVLKTVFDTDKLQFSTNDNHLFFTNSHRQLISQKIDGKFPAYERIIPRENQHAVSVNRVRLVEALHRVGLVAEDHGGLILEFHPDQLVLSARKADVGDAIEAVPIEFSGAPLRLCCHWEYLLNFLEMAAGQNVVLSLHDAEKPLLLQDGADYLGVVMLMRA